MENKKLYAEPLCEVTRFAVEDIVAVSSWNTQEFSIVDVNTVVE